MRCTPFAIQKLVLASSGSHPPLNPTESLNFLSLAASSLALPDSNSGRLLAISRFLNHSLYICLFFLFSSAFAASPCIDLPNVYLPSGKRCSFGNLYASFDFLYWEGFEKGLEYAIKNVEEPFHQKNQIYEPAFGFHPAFRLGVGTHLPYEDWDLEFNYTRYYTKTTASTNQSFNDNPNGGIFSVWLCSTAFQENAFLVRWQDSQAVWKLNSNIYDLFLKIPFCIGPWMTLVPGFGLQFALQQMRYKVLYENGNSISAGDATSLFLSSQIAMKNRSLNLGPSARIRCQWNLFDSFDIHLFLSGSLLATQFKVGRNESDLFTNNGAILLDSLRQKNCYWTLRPNAGMSLGFGWSHCICKPKRAFYYGFCASYEAQVWWKQNMLYRYIDQTHAAMIYPTQGDLFFHGLTLDGFIDF